MLEVMTVQRGSYPAFCNILIGGDRLMICALTSQNYAQPSHKSACNQALARSCRACPRAKRNIRVQRAMIFHLSLASILISACHSTPEDPHLRAYCEDHCIPVCDDMFAGNDVFNRSARVTCVPSCVKKCISNSQEE